MTTRFYYRRLLTLKNGAEVEHQRTIRGGREAWDQTTYRVLPLDAKHCNDRASFIVKSDVVSERRVRVAVKES